MGMTARFSADPNRAGSDRAAWLLPLLAALSLALAPARVTAQVIDAWLGGRMAQAVEDERLDVYVVLAAQLDAGVLGRRFAALPPRERRAAVAGELRAHADATQGALHAALAAQVEAGRARLVDRLWMGNALVLEAEPAAIAALAAVPGVDRIRAVRATSPEQVQDAPAGDSGAYPFFDDFDGGALAAHWTVAATGAGRVTVTTDYGPLGSHHAVFDAATAGVDSVASITVQLDLAGQRGVGLRFRHKELTLNGVTGSDENHPEDGVFVSEDGVAFQRILLLNDGPAQYGVHFLSLDDAVAALDLEYTSAFRVRFQWRDNFSAPDDGMAFDVIEIGPGVDEPPPVLPEDNLVAQQAPQLWDLGLDGAGVLVGSIDSGTWKNHPDLVQRLWTNPGEIAGNAVDDDGNGYVDDTWGWDFENDDNEPQSSDAHGTQSAGLIVGDGSSGSLTGMAPGATLVTCQVESEAQYWLAQQYLLEVGVDVVSSSYSYKWPDRPDHHMFRQLCDLELAAGIIHANSIGNQGGQQVSHPVPMNISTPGNVPGPFWHPAAVQGGRSSVLSCGGLNLADDTLYAPGGRGPSAWEDLLLYDGAWPHAQVAAYWDYPYGGFSGGSPGLLKPDLVAYTNSVTSTAIPAGSPPVYYAPFSGTSAATPQLGGALCLLRAAQPAAEPRHLAAALQLTALDLGPAGKDTDFGAGRLRAFDAARRLVVLAKAVPDEVPVGGAIVVEIHGLPDTLAFGFLGLGLTTSAGQWNLAPPFFGLPALMLDSAGRLDIPMTVPNDPAFAGLVVWMQFGQPMATLDWGLGKFFSVPEAVTITP